MAAHSGQKPATSPALTVRLCENPFYISINYFQYVFLEKNARTGCLFKKIFSPFFSFPKKVRGNVGN